MSEGGAGLRVDGLDVVRMAACLAVVLFHADIDVLGGTPGLDRGLYGVQVFMVLSGYLLARPYLELPGPALPWRAYLARRLARLVPAYYVVVLLLAGVIAAGGGDGRAAARLEGPLWWHVATHLTFLHGLFAATHLSLASALWSMSLEGQYTLLLPPLVLALRRLSPGVLLASGVAASLGFRAALLGHAIPGGPHLLQGFFLGRLPEFLLGVLLAHALSPRHPGALRRLLAMTTVGGGMALATFGPVTAELAVAAGALLLVAAVRLLGPARVTGAPARLARTLGRVSYSTYLVHLPAGKALLALHAALGPGAGAPPPALFAAYVVAGHVAGLAFHAAVERPASRWLGRVLAGPPAAAAPAR